MSRALRASAARTVASASGAAGSSMGVPTGSRGAIGASSCRSRSARRLLTELGAEPPLLMGELGRAIENWLSIWSGACRGHCAA